MSSQECTFLKCENTNYMYLYECIDFEKTNNSVRKVANKMFLNRSSNFQTVVFISKSSENRSQQFKKKLYLFRVDRHMLRILCKK